MVRFRAAVLLSVGLVSTRLRLVCGNSTSPYVTASANLLPAISPSLQAFRVYELGLQIPKSTCGVQVAHFHFEMIAQACNLQTCTWHPTVVGDTSYQYRGTEPGLVDVSPSAGMINHGNNDVTITIELENIVKLYDRINVTLDNQTCTPKGNPIYIQTDDSAVVSIQVVAPQFPRQASGKLTLKVTVGSFIFTRPWTFLEPPSPMIERDSVRVDGELRDPLWLKKISDSSDRPNPTLQFYISSLSSLYGSAFSELHVFFHGSRQRVETERFANVGADAKLSFQLNIKGMVEGIYNITVRTSDHQFLIILPYITPNP